MEDKWWYVFLCIAVICFTGYEFYEKKLDDDLKRFDIEQSVKVNCKGKD